jgi:hypothetical protein
MIDLLSEYESANHLDIMFFAIIWTFLMVEYYLWRVNFK